MHGKSPLAEYAIVSQLLAKIQELEETNAQIHEDQKRTEERMRAAQWDAESIRRVYDCLDNGDIDVEVQEEDEDLFGSSDDEGSTRHHKYEYVHDPIREAARSKDWAEEVARRQENIRELLDRKIRLEQAQAVASRARKASQ